MLRYVVLSLIFLFINASAIYAKNTELDMRRHQSTKLFNTLNHYSIQVIAPASGVTQDMLDDVRYVVGENASIPNDLLSQQTKFYSNTDLYRLNHLKNVLGSHSENSLILCLRGGYGVTRIVDDLLNMQKPKIAKIVVGYSDITALHLFLSQSFGWQTIHGPVLTDAINPSKDLAGIKILTDLLNGKIDNIIIPDLVPLNDAAKSSKAISSQITGGNLTIIQTSIGTKWQIQASGKILFLEDWSEPGYKIDRMLTHLRSAGCLDDVAAVIFGDFEAAKADTEVEYALKKFALDYKIPVYQTDKIGHGKYNYPILYNAPALIDFENGVAQLRIDAKQFISQLAKK